jgi:hypothetical protein
MHVIFLLWTYFIHIDTMRSSFHHLYWRICLSLNCASNPSLTKHTSCTCNQLITHASLSSTYNHWPATDRLTCRQDMYTVSAGDAMWNSVAHAATRLIRTAVWGLATLWYREWLNERWTLKALFFEHLSACSPRCSNEVHLLSRLCGGSPPGRLWHPRRPWDIICGQS